MEGEGQCITTMNPSGYFIQLDLKNKILLKTIVSYMTFGLNEEWMVSLIMSIYNHG